MVIISDIQLPKTNDGVLKVSDISTEAGGDLSARQTITDPQTSTFVKTDAEGRLNILESSVEGAGSNNSLNTTAYAVKQMGAFDGSAYRVAKCSNVGRLEVDINSGGGSIASKAGNDTNSSMAAVGVFASINGTADYRSIQVDSAGALNVRLDGSNDHVRITGLNSAGANKGVGVEDTDGGILSAGKIVVNDPSSADGTRQLLRLNTKHELAVNPSVSEKEQVDIFSVGQSIAAGASSTSSSIELKGHGKAHIFIKTGSTNQSGTFQLSGDGNNFYLPSSGGTLTPAGTPTADMLVAEVETGAKYIRVIYTNTGGSGANIITSSKLTYA